MQAREISTKFVISPTHVTPNAALLDSLVHGIRDGLLLVLRSIACVAKADDPVDERRGGIACSQLLNSR